MSPGFSGKNRGMIPSVAAPGVTHLSDATVTGERNKISLGLYYKKSVSYPRA